MKNVKRVGKVMKSRIGMKLGLAAVLALSAAPALVLSPAPAAAAAAAAAPEREGRAPNVWLGQDQVLEIRDVRSFQAEDMNVFSFEAVIENRSGTDLQLDDYYMRLKTASGSSVDLRLLPEDQSKKAVAAGSKEVYRFYGTSSSGGSIGTSSGLTLEVGRWDFHAASLEAPLGSVALSDARAGYGDGIGVLVPAGSTRLEARISDVVWRSAGEEKEAIVTVTLHNGESKPVRLPDWGYWLETAEGAVYTLTPAGKSAGQTIEPGTALAVGLTVMLPTEVDPAGASLVLTRGVPETGAGGSSGGSGSGAGTTAVRHVPVSALPVPAAAEEPSAGGSRTVAMAEGTYTAAVESLERWPWEDCDVVTAAVTLTNASESALPVPEISGILRADGTAEWPAETFRSDSTRLLQPGQSTRIFLQAGLDHEEEVRLWDVILQERVAEGGGEGSGSVYRTEWRGLEVQRMQEVAAGDRTDLSGVGGSWEYAAQAPVTYESTTAKVVSVQVDALNRDKRYSPVTQWVAQFVMADGTVYPAEAESAGQKVIPQGKAALQIWAALPKGVDTQGMKLMLGLAVTGGKLSGPGDRPDSFLQAAVFHLPDTGVSTQQDGAGGLQLYPYTLAISNIRSPYWYFNELSFSFDYSLERDLSVVTEMKDRKVVVELVDGSGKKLHEEAYALEQVEAGRAGTTGWSIGSDTVKWETSVSNISVDSSGYTLNIYEEIKPGYRRLIGSIAPGGRTAL